jgi:hypothetical protein
MFVSVSLVPSPLLSRSTCEQRHDAYSYDIPSRGINANKRIMWVAVCKPAFETSGVPAVTDPPDSLDATCEFVHTAIPTGTSGTRFVRLHQSM